jgi:molybdopterin-guanine dinucleotide biosynthesis adapter protein
VIVASPVRWALMPKIETHRQAAGRDLLAATNPTIRAIASDVPLDSRLPRFDLDDVAGIAAFIRAEVGP